MRYCSGKRWVYASMITLVSFFSVEHACEPAQADGHAAACR
ncbi:KxYKxGKxW signal peptide domain-containing protein [Sinorhizobium medicae]